MLRGSKRALTAGALSALVCLAGCDNAQNQADKKVRAIMREASALKQDASESAQDTYVRKLNEAVSTVDASSAVKAQATAALAEAEHNAAKTLALKLQRTVSDQARLLWEIAQLTDQIRTSGNAIAGFARFDPKPAIDAINAKVADARGGADKTAWFTHDSGVIPTLFAAEQQIASLQGELARQTEQLASLRQQRARAIDEAEKASVQADKLKGDESLAAFKQGSELRKQAGNLAVEIDKITRQVEQLNRSLAVAQGQQAAVAGVIAQFNEQAQSLDQSWKSMDAQRAAHRKLSAEILGATPAEAASSGAGGTIATKAVVADRLDQEIQKLREDAIANANKAADHFAQAYAAANAAAMELRAKTGDPRNAGRPEIKIWQDMIKVLEPLQFRLQQASVHRLLGELHLDYATLLNNRINVRDSLNRALEGTGLAIPMPLTGQQWAEQRNQAIKDADEAFKASDEMLAGLTEGTSEAMRPIAHLERALTQYSWAQAARLSGDAALASSRIATSRTERNLAAESNIPIPNMPAELGPIPAKAPPAPEAEAVAPASEPAAEPATAPAAVQP